MLKLISNPCRFMCVKSETLFPFSVLVQQFSSITSGRRILFPEYSETISTLTIRSKMNANLMDLQYYKKGSGGRDYSRDSNDPGFYREFETPDHVYNSFPGSNLEFKVLSYNVLAQGLLEDHKYLYTSCSQNSLNWKSRFSLIFNEVLSIDPEIICFQEVQMDHVNQYFRKFEQYGYTGIFKWKTGTKIDGLAIYYKHHIFSLLDTLDVEFFQPNLALLNKDNVGLMVKLVDNSTPCTPFVVATTHLLYNPQRTDIRLAQMKLLLAEIDRFSYSYVNDKPGHYPIILTGDFNSKPDSPVIELLDNGYVYAAESISQCDWVKLGITDNSQHLPVFLDRLRGNPMTNPKALKIINKDAAYGDISQFGALFNTKTVAHPLNLQSVYNKVKSNGENEATTYQNNWVTVDYIYFSIKHTLGMTNLHISRRKHRKQNQWPREQSPEGKKELARKALRADLLHNNNLQM